MENTKSNNSIVKIFDPKAILFYVKKEWRKEVYCRIGLAWLGFKILSFKTIPKRRQTKKKREKYELMRGVIGLIE